MFARRFACTLLLFVASTLSPGSIRAAEDRIPLEDFFRDPAFTEIELSPDGTKVSALSIWKDQPNLYVIDLKTRSPAMLTGMTSMGVANVRWVTNDRLIFTGVEDGYSTGGLFAIDANGKHSRALIKSVRQQGNRGSWVYRGGAFLGYIGGSSKEILITSNERHQFEPDVYRINVRNGIKDMVALNPGDVTEWIPDAKGSVRAGFATDGREQVVLYRGEPNGEWKEVARHDFASGVIRPLAFEKSGKLLYVASNLGRDTAVLATFDPQAGEIVEELYGDDTYDVSDVILSRADHSLLGVLCEKERSYVVWLDPDMNKLQALVDRELPDTVNSFTSRSLDNKWVVILAHSDRDPGTYYLLNTVELTMEKIVRRCDWIDPQRMAQMRPIQYQARDGMTIHGYLTLPQGAKPENLPLIVNPHGGPWFRDSWGFNPEVQFLASRGYAVLQMNFRGSTGYGRKLLEAGYGQWGLSMQDDITDGVKWAIEQGFADPKRVCIYGASYGGYATMAGLAFTPDLYCCGVNYVGVTDIELLLKTIPKAWEAGRAQLEAMTGNEKTDRERLEATSPMLHADQIHAPVFFAYGERDDRVDMKHATRFIGQLRKNGVEVEFMSRPDEGHGYRRWDNKIEYYRALEAFLAKHMNKGAASTNVSE